MILTKTVEIINTKVRYKRYVKKGALENKSYNKTLKTFTVDMKYIGLSTSIDIEFKCDYCGVVFIEKYISRNNRQKNSTNKKDSCGSKACAFAKFKESNMERHGSEFPMNVKGTISNQRRKETMLDKYGYEYNVENPDVRKKAIDNYMNNFDEALKKREETCLKKYGTKYSSQNEDIKNKTKITNNIRYGGNNSMHNEEIFLKNQKSGLNMYNYKDTKLTYQGTYELDFIEYCYMNNIEIQNGQRIPYIFGGVNKKYYADFYLPKFNLIIEIKSIWTYNLAVAQNEAKKQICLDNGYLFMFLFDKNYTEFENFLKNKHINKK